MYLRQNGTEEFLGDLRDVSQPTVSRIVTVLVPIIKAVLAEFVPEVQDAIEVVKGRVVLVDGTITPCWSYADHHELWNREHGTTWFNAHLVSLLEGQAVYISELLDGCTHDAKAFADTDVATVVRHSGGAVNVVTGWSHRVRNRRGESSAGETRNATPAAGCSSSRSAGVLNNTPSFRPAIGLYFFKEASHKPQSILVRARKGLAQWPVDSTAARTFGFTTWLWRHNIEMFHDDKDTG